MNYDTIKMVQRISLSQHKDINGFYELSDQIKKPISNGW
jgi:hypothetical protein